MKVGKEKSMAMSNCLHVQVDEMAPMASGRSQPYV